MPCLAELVLERILVLAQIRRVIGIGHGEARRQVGVEQPCPLQLGETRKVLDRVEAEMAEELLGGAVGQGRPGARLRPLSLIQPVSSSTSRVPLEVLTPLISSISARVTGW